MNSIQLIQTGDWVRTPAVAPGVWKVYRTLRGFKEDRWSLDEPLQPSRRCILFSVRLANDSWKRSFSHQACEASLAQTISTSERERVEGLLSSDETLAKAFEKYQASTKPIDLVANLGFGEFSDQEVKEFPATCNRLLADRIEDGLTMDDVLTILRESGLDAYRHKFPNRATLQLVSTGHELREDRFLYRGFRILSF